MTIAEFCVFAAVILYLITVAPVKALGYRTFDNANPRDPSFYRSGIRARALGAHINGIETFPSFAAAVLFAECRHMPQQTVDVLALMFVGLRLLFVLAYLASWSTTRTIIWNIGFLVNSAIFFLPLIHAF